METLLVPGAHLELAPVFFVLAVVIAVGLRRAARRRRPGGAASSDPGSYDQARDRTTPADRGPGSPG